jgi:hypothetical protein
MFEVMETGPAAVSKLARPARCLVVMLGWLVLTPAMAQEMLTSSFVYRVQEADIMVAMQNEGFDQKSITSIKSAALMTTIIKLCGENYIKSTTTKNLEVLVDRIATDHDVPLKLAAERTTQFARLRITEISSLNGSLQYCRTVKDILRTDAGKK